MQTQVVNVAPPRASYGDRMARAREFCADHAAATSSQPPQYSQEPQAVQQPMQYAQQPPQQYAQPPLTQYAQQPVQHGTGGGLSPPVAAAPHITAENSLPAGNGVFVAPQLSSPAQIEDVRSYILQHGPQGGQLVQCMLQRRKNHTYELFLRDETRNLELGQAAPVPSAPLRRRLP